MVKKNNYNNKSHAPINQKPKQCNFCVNNINYIDYKDAVTLKRFTSSYAKIAPRKRSGVCAKHQRSLATAIKRARIMALLPFTNK
ncbi:MAG: 30S ribosomal protein S18 [Candidatus Buchananbacteria bacterium]|nr:30S ribosomal protein S18 [Candidatus Buchananbacteria bacterium]